MERLGTGVEAAGLRGVIPESSGQRLMERTGLALRRHVTPEGNASVLLFLRSSGALWVRLPGAARGSVRFGGAVEPLVWGVYQLQRTRKDVYLKEVEVKADFWALRERPHAMSRALRWCVMLDRWLLRGYPYDDLLPLLYWALAALQEGASPGLVSLRFVWRWLASWGLAPDLRRCGVCGRRLDGVVVPGGDGLCCPSCGSGATLAVAGLADYLEGPSSVPPADLSLADRDATVLWDWLCRFFELNR